MPGPLNGHEPTGPVTRKFEALLMKPYLAVLALILSTIFGGGGVVSFKAVADKLDAQAAKLQELQLSQTAKLSELQVAITKIEASSTARDSAAAQQASEIRGLGDRVGGLDRNVARDGVEIDELKRRVAALEGKGSK